MIDGNWFEKEETDGECKCKRPQEKGKMGKKSWRVQYMMVMTHIHYTQVQRFLLSLHFSLIYPSMMMHWGGLMALGVRMVCQFVE